MARRVVTPSETMSERIERVLFSALDAMTFDEIIDVRAPEEYGIDHITGAINLPVLQDEERVRVGTLHHQQGPFDARKVGAGLVAANISMHLEKHFFEKPKGYRPVIYCWRGGQRSRSLATVLCEVGWRPIVLEGGYKNYRSHVIEAIETMAPQFRWHVLNGYTGSGKTLILKALMARGAQVLDLEGLANHKGSLFGGDLECPQPLQKRFETLIHDQLRSFSPDRLIFVEAESPKIGHANIPAALWHAIRNGPVTEILSPVEARAHYLYGDYDSWIMDSDRILATIERLRPFHSAAQIDQWKRQCQDAAWEPLIHGLLTEHYDKRYGSAGTGHYGMPEKTYPLANQSESAIAACSDWLMKNVDEVD
ncbi:MAG: tRNA 2-selenouridine synthase [Verrucomicrobiales bacterium]|jgi:tRNA 2-selenouridine synthase